MRKTLELNCERSGDTEETQIPLEEKEEASDLMENSQRQQKEEAEEQEAEAVKEDVKEQQRPCYSHRTVTRPQTQARPPVPMVTSPRPARR